MGKIRNFFIKQHTRGRLRYLWWIQPKCYLLILFEINIDNNIKGEPNENNLKQKIIISIISSKEIKPPFIKNENIIKPNEKTKKTT